MAFNRFSNCIHSIVSPDYLEFPNAIPVVLHGKLASKILVVEIVKAIFSRAS